MGRKKIKIEPIQEGRTRQVTYLKRKAGLFKKAYELATLTDSQVAVIVFGHNGRLSQFCSTDMDAVLFRYTEHNGPVEHKRAEDFASLAGGDGPGNDDDDDHKGGSYSYEPRGPPGGSAGPSNPGGSGSSSLRTAGSDSFFGQGGSLGQSGAYGNSFAGSSIGGESSAGGSGGYKSMNDDSPNQAALDDKMDPTPSLSGPNSTVLSVLDKPKAREAIRRKPRGQSSASTSSSRRPGFAVRDRTQSANDQHDLYHLTPQRLSTLSPNGRMEGGSGPNFSSSSGTAQWPLADTTFAFSPPGTSSSAATSIAPQHQWFQTRRNSELPHLDPFPTVLTRCATADGHPSASHGREWGSRFDQSKATAAPRQDYATSGFLMQQPLPQRRATTLGLNVRQPSFASLEGPSLAPNPRSCAHGTTPFVPGMPMTSTIMPQTGTGAVESDNILSPSSGTGSNYGFFGGIGRASNSRDGSTPGLSASSLPVTRRGTVEHGISTGPSGSSSDGTPILVDSSLTTPGASPVGSLQAGTMFPPDTSMSLVGGTGYFETTNLPESAKSMMHPVNGTQQQLAAFMDPAPPSTFLPYFGGGAYHGL